MHRAHSWLMLGTAVLVVACLSPRERQAKLLAQVDAAVEAGDLPRAMTKLRAAIAYDPRDIQAVTRLAEVLVRAEQDQAAATLLDQFPAEVSRDPRFLNLKTRLMLRTGRVMDAVPIVQALDARGTAEPATVQATLDALVNQRPQPDDLPTLPNPWRLTLVSLLLTDGGSTNLAAEWLRTLPVGADPQSKVADELLAEVLRTNRQELPDGVLALAEAADTANKLLIMRRHFTARQDWPGLAQVEARFLADYRAHAAWTDVALASAWRALRAGQPEVAERLAREVSALDPVSVESVVVRGLALRERGRESEARRAFELALALDPHDEAAERALSSRTRQDPGPIQLDFSLRSATPRGP